MPVPWSITRNRTRRAALHLQLHALWPGGAVNLSALSIRCARFAAGDTSSPRICTGVIGPGAAAPLSLRHALEHVDGLHAESVQASQMLPGEICPASASARSKSRSTSVPSRLHSSITSSSSSAYSSLAGGRLRATSTELRMAASGELARAAPGDKLPVALDVGRCGPACR
jgi:hypothetical protein